MPAIPPYGISRVSERHNKSPTCEHAPTSERIQMSDKTPERGTPHYDEINRLRRIEGQVRGLQRMIEEDRYCIDILTQIRSVSRALSRVSDSILQRHLRHCVTHAMHSGDQEAVRMKVDEIITVLERAR